MKYGSEQIYKVIKRGQSLHKEEVKKRLALREKYPVEVEIKDGFYIIESQMNKE